MLKNLQILTSMPLIAHCTYSILFICTKVQNKYDKYHYYHCTHNDVTPRFTLSLHIYCTSGSFRVFKFSRIPDILGFSLNLQFTNFHFSLVFFTNNFREILEFASLSSSSNTRKLKPREYYQIYRYRVLI